MKISSLIFSSWMCGENQHQLRAIPSVSHVVWALQGEIITECADFNVQLCIKCQISGLVQDYSNSIADALELLQSLHQAIEMITFGIRWWQRIDCVELSSNCLHESWDCWIYPQTSNIRCTLGNKIVDHSDVVGALPIGTAPTTSSFLDLNPWLQQIGQRRQDENYLSFGIWCGLY